MTADEALKILDSFLQSEKLNNLEENIFRQSWQNKTYCEIAASSGYNDDYVREIGGKLWKILSQAFEAKINKKNFKAVLERKFRQYNSRTIDRHRDWQDASDLSGFCGRHRELATIERWIVSDRCRLIGIFGMGGMGKTSLAVKIAEQTAAEFDFLIWRSLRNALPLDLFIATIIRFLQSHQQTTKPELRQENGIDSSICNLIRHLHSYRCLLVIDDAEAILQSGSTCGNFRSGYERYGELIERLGEIPHQSCVILTSREKPREFNALAGSKLPVRSLHIKGLGAEIIQDICQLKGSLYGSQRDWHTLTDSYSGNPLVLKIVATVIQQLFDSEVGQFLQQEILFFDDIDNLLIEQLNRLCRLEREIMYFLSVEKQPVTLTRLQTDLLSSIDRKKLLEAIASLQRRSLIEKSTAGFFQLPLVRQYLLERQSQEVWMKFR